MNINSKLKESVYNNLINKYHTKSNSVKINIVNNLNIKLNKNQIITDFAIGIAENEDPTYMIVISYLINHRLPIKTILVTHYPITNNDDIKLNNTINELNYMLGLNNNLPFKHNINNLINNEQQNLLITFENHHLLIDQIISLCKSK